MDPAEEIAALKKQVTDLQSALEAAKKPPPSGNPAPATARQVEILQQELTEAKKDLAEFKASLKKPEPPAPAPKGGAETPKEKQWWND